MPCLAAEMQHTLATPLVMTNRLVAVIGLRVLHEGNDSLDVMRHPTTKGVIGSMAPVGSKGLLVFARTVATGSMAATGTGSPVFRLRVAAVCPAMVVPRGPA